MLKLTIMTFALLGASQSALAQLPPGAGGQLQQIPPAPAPKKVAPEIKVNRQEMTTAGELAGVTVRVQSMHVNGNTLFPEAQLIAASGFTPGADLKLSELRALAANIAAYYNRRGYFLAQAYLPEQDVTAGEVTITVIEGRYGNVDLHNGTNLSDGLASGMLHGLDRGDPVASAPLERRLLLLSDVPGVLVKSTLSPGSEVGTSDLLVELAPGPLVTGSVEADNAGNRYTGRYRFGGTINLNNAAGIGDRLSLRLLASAGGLAYGRASYQVQVGDGQLGAAFTHLHYDLGREFKSLDADGTADIVSVFGSYPLIRSRDANLYALLSLDGKKLEDRIGLFSAESDKRSGAVTAGLSGDSHDSFGGGGWNWFSLGWTVGDLHIEDPIERAFDAATAHSEGGFSKIMFSAARLQTVTGPLSLYGAIRGQLAFDNLDSSEKMELGGAQGVRSYPEGEAYGDQGYIATAEARLALNQLAGTVPGELQLIAFVDVGEVEYSHDPWFPGSNHATRSGFGGGVNWFGPEGFIVRASYAHKLGDAVTTSGPDKSGRFWFQVAKLF